MILITGGCGFIGSSLASALIEEGHEVAVADNLFLGRKENIPDKAKFYNVSVADKDIDQVFRENDFEHVFHFAALSSAPMYLDGRAPDVRDWIDVNVRGFTNIMDNSVRREVRKVIFASTSSMYSGNPLPYKEDQSIRPSTFYETTIRTRELLADTYRKMHGFPSAAMRYFSVYGYNEKHKGKYANLVSQFLWNLQNNQQPVIYGDGSQTRDFTFITDVNEANVLAMEKLDGIFNVGTGKSTSVMDMARMLIKKTGKDAEPKTVENPIKNYVEHTEADISKIRKHGFEPTVDLETGIEKLTGEEK